MFGPNFITWNWLDQFNPWSCRSLLSTQELDSVFDSTLEFQLTSSLTPSPNSSSVPNSCSPVSTVSSSWLTNVTTSSQMWWKSIESVLASKCNYFEVWSLVVYWALLFLTPQLKLYMLNHVQFVSLNWWLYHKFVSEICSFQFTQLMTCK